MKLEGTARLVAMQAKSVEELLELAKEHDYSVSKEEAEEVFAELSKEGELSDEELENVAGGACYSKDPHGNLITTIFNKCRLFKQEGRAIKGFPTGCSDCQYSWKSAGTMYCKARTRKDDPVRRTHTRTISG